MTGVIYKISASLLIGWIAVAGVTASAQATVEPIRYGDFNSWLKRNITESVVIGGQQKIVYAIAPEGTICGNTPYKPDGESPWATTNVCARISGVTKASNAVYPSARTRDDKCAKLCTQIETIKVLGLINVDVMVAGTIFLGEMTEPVSTSQKPFAFMDMGIPYSKRPKALKLDYKVDVPDVDTRIRAAGFGGKKTIPGRDRAAVMVLLQRRWEDENGALHAMRVGTGGETFSESCSWHDDHTVDIHYGDCSQSPALQWLDLRNSTTMPYYARNSHGELVPVEEEGWDAQGATPTHVIVMISSGNGEPYVGTEGMTLYVDNVAFVF